eukprot:5845509-Pyramimonas_sp.AAC.1
MLHCTTTQRSDPSSLRGSYAGLVFMRLPERIVSQYSLHSGGTSSARAGCPAGLPAGCPAELWAGCPAERGAAFGAGAAKDAAPAADEDAPAEPLGVLGLPCG